MHTAMPEAELKEVLDRITRKVTKDSTGIQLVRGAPGPGEMVYTVHIRFCRGFCSGLSLRVDAAMLTRLTQSMLKKEQVTLRELEEVAKEYFNMLCGHIVAALFKSTRVAARFSVPTLHLGSYSPEDCQEQFSLHYFGDRDEAAQLVHHIPALQERAEVGTKSNQF